MGQSGSFVTQIWQFGLKILTKLILSFNFPNKCHLVQRAHQVIKTVSWFYRFLQAGLLHTGIYVANNGTPKSIKSVVVLNPILTAMVFVCMALYLVWVLLPPDKWCSFLCSTSHMLLWFDLIAVGAMESLNGRLQIWSFQKKHHCKGGGFVGSTPGP